MFRRFRNYPQIGGKRGGIPSGWVELDYVESTEEQFIKTNFVPNNKSGAYVRAMPLTTGGNHIIYGARQNRQDTRFGNNFSAYLEWSWGTYEPLKKYFKGKWYEIENNFLNSRVGKCDGVVYRTSYPALPTITYPCYVFAWNAYGSTVAYLFVGRISDLKFSQGNEVAMHLVGVRNATTNEVAMCDILTGDIYRNAGTGSFIAGPDKVG